MPLKIRRSVLIAYPRMRPVHRSHPQFVFAISWTSPVGMTKGRAALPLRVVAE
jgi:hypothetical protein